MGLKKRFKKVFFDFEFTGEHQFTTPVSLGMVGEANEELYITFKDYNKIQVTDWLRENVISKIDENKSISKEDGLIKITEWLNNYRNDGYISLISFGKTIDLILLFQLWHTKSLNVEYFHYLHHLPDFLNHSSHFDLTTTFHLAGINPDIDREKFLNLPKGKRHDALYDAKIVKNCYEKLLTKQNFPMSMNDKKTI